jgi:MFS family permease
MAAVPLWRNRTFTSLWLGIVLAEVGARAAVAASLYQVYVLTDSIAMVGLIGLANATALLVLSPIGGVYADRLDRRRLLQVAQLLTLVVAGALAWVTYSGSVEPWHVIGASLLTMAAATFDRPARQALISALVPREQLGQAIALLNPSREVAVLVGPALAGLMIAVGGPGLVYAFDAATHGLLVLLLLAVRVAVGRAVPTGSVVSLLRGGIEYVRGRRIIWSLMSLDLVQTFFGAYRVLLPALALDVLDVGPTGYGILAATPSLGAIVGARFIYGLARRRRAGQIVLHAVAAYGLACIAFAHAPGYAFAIVAAAALGFFDALAATIRLAAVQLETPDALRGRVTSLYQLTARGGPSLGDANMGWLGALLGPVVALSLGGLVPVLVAAGVWKWGLTVRNYTAPVLEPAASEREPEKGPAPPP